MSTITTLFCGINMPGQCHNRFLLEKAIRETETEIEDYKRKIRDLVMMTEPDKFFGSDDDMYEKISYMFDYNMRLLCENIECLHDFYLLRHYWDKCHDKESGKEILPPESFNFDTAYLKVLYDNQELIKGGGI